MDTGSIGQTSGTSNNSSTSGTAAKKNALGQDAFLQLLTTQLAHQDPTAPQDNSQMIAQLAQFSSLEQLTQIQKSLTAIGTALGVDMSAITDSSSSTSKTSGSTGA